MMKLGNTLKQVLMREMDTLYMKKREILVSLKRMNSVALLEHCQSIKTNQKRKVQFVMVVMSTPGLQKSPEIIIY